MLSQATSKLREWGLFFAVALLPATAIGMLGLRALLNEEAAIRREMRLGLEQTTAAARGQFESTLADLSAGRIEAAPFADRLSLEPERGSGMRPSPSARVATAPDCATHARRLRAGDGSAAAREALLRDCETHRENGRMLWLVLALTREAAVPRPRLERWLRDHGDDLGAAERALARRELADASWLPQLERDALTTLLDGYGRGSTPPLGSAQRQAMRAGKPRITWSDASSRGLLTLQDDGTYRGFIVHAGTLGRALQSGWPSIPSDVTATLVVGLPRDDATRFEVLPGGAQIALAHKDPSVVDARTQRSKRLLIAVATVSVTVAVALAALLFARVRRERRVGALRTDFVAAVSHELRTPIASLRMLSELLAEGSVEDPNEQREMHRALAREAKRLGETVNRLLGFSRMEAGKQAVRRSVAAVAPVVRAALETVLERHPELELTTELDGSIEAPIDGEAIQMAVTNLLTNAVKYAKPPYAVLVRHHDGGVRIDVRDSGPGLSRRDQKRVFRPFERADDRLSEATEGSGIGLSLVGHVARSHRGRAGVESDLGRGSTFYLWLPTQREAARRGST